MKITLLEPTLVFGPYSMKKLGKPGTAMPRYAYAPSRQVSLQRHPALADDVDLAEIVRRRVARRAQHDVDIQLGAVGGHQRTRAQ